MNEIYWMMNTTVVVAIMTATAIEIEIKTIKRIRMIIWLGFYDGCANYDIKEYDQ